MLTSDPKRLNGVIQYATNPDNIEGQVITVSPQAQSLLKDAVRASEREDYMNAFALIAKAEKYVNQDLQADGNLYLTTCALSLS